MSTQHTLRPSTSTDSDDNEVHPSRYMPGCSPTRDVRSDPRRRMLEHLTSGGHHSALLDELDDMMDTDRRYGTRGPERRFDDADAERLRLFRDGFSPFPPRSPTPPRRHVYRPRDSEGPSAAWQAWRNQIDLFSLDPTPAEAAHAFERQYRRQNAMSERLVRAIDPADTINSLPQHGSRQHGEQSARAPSANDPRRTVMQQQLSALGQVYQLAGQDSPTARLPSVPRLRNRAVQLRNARSPAMRDVGPTMRAADAPAVGASTAMFAQSRGAPSTVLSMREAVRQQARTDDASRRQRTYSALLHGMPWPVGGGQSRSQPQRVPFATEPHPPAPYPARDAVPRRDTPTPDALSDFEAEPFLRAVSPPHAPTTLAEISLPATRSARPAADHELRGAERAWSRLLVQEGREFGLAELERDAGAAAVPRADSPRPLFTERLARSQRTYGDPGAALESASLARRELIEGEAAASRIVQNPRSTASLSWRSRERGRLVDSDAAATARSDAERRDRDRAPTRFGLGPCPTRSRSRDGGPPALRNAPPAARVAASDFVRAGVQFEGMQSFTGAVAGPVRAWKVVIELSHVDWAAGKLNGTLTAHGLPHQEGAITSFWRGEMVDVVHATFESPQFNMVHTDDLKHWSQFAAFRSLGLRHPAAMRTVTPAQLERTGCVFMRWKELSFLSPTKDQETLTIAGFYYVCMDRATGAIEAWYHDPSTMPLQRLDLAPRAASHGQSFGNVAVS